MSLNFCPSCSNLLTYVHTPERQLIMKCQGCNRPVKDISNVCVYFNKFVQNSYDIKIDPDQCHDNTLPYTDSIECLNPECKTHGYEIFAEEQVKDLIVELGEEEGNRQFNELGGLRGEWLTTAWASLSAEEKSAYKSKSNLNSKINYFHYNKDMKLAYICCYCQTYWKN